jgi:hypothetical protein
MKKNPKTAKPRTDQLSTVVDTPSVALAPLPSPMTVLQQAIAGGAGIDVLERLLVLQERWEATQARKDFDAAMAALRADLPTIVKTREVDFSTAKGRTHYRYEDLACVTEAVSPAMAAHGLSFRWQTDSSAPGAIRVTCVVSHAAGHVELTTLSCANDDSGNKNDIQAIGSAVTYLQRYTLKAALGLAASADDDGRSRGPRVPSDVPSPPATVPPVAQHDGLDKPITHDARGRLWSIARGRGRSDAEVGEYLKTRFKVSASKDILRRDYDTIIQAIEHPGPLLAREPGAEG